MDVVWQRRVSARAGTSRSIVQPRRFGALKAHSRERRFIRCNSRQHNVHNDKITPTPTAGNGWRSFWAAVDAGAWLGALGTAAAFVATQEALLIAGPLILPIIALYAGKEKSTIDEKWSQARIESQFSSAVRQLVALSEEGTAEMAEEVAAALSVIESKGSDTTLGDKIDAIVPIVERLEKTVKDGDEKFSNSIRRSTDAVGEGLKKLRGDVRNDLQSAATEEVAALARLDSRIGALERAINGLDSAQSDNFRRLTANLSSTLSIEEDTLSSAVKAEVWKSLEPVRQLPQILTQTLPRLTTNDQAYEPSLTEEGAKKIFSIELENLKNMILTEQQNMLEELSEWTAKIDSSQWNQLGAKLEELDEKLTILEQKKDNSSAESTSDTFLTEIRNDFKSLSRDLEALGSNMASLREENRPLNPAPQLNMSRAIQTQLEHELVDALELFCQGLKDRADAELDPREIAQELSLILVDTFSRVLDETQMVTYNGNEAKASETQSREGTELGSAADTDASTGVPIASWLSDKELEGVPIKKSEEISFKRSSDDQATIEPSISVKPQDVEIDLTEEPGDSKAPEEMPEILSKASDVSEYQRGLDIMKDGRSAFEDGDYELADKLLEEADACFAQRIQDTPGDIKSIGNRGNTLMARAKTKLMMANIKFEESVAGAEDDEQQALEMLIQAGRLYRQILEIDPSEGKAFVNWGRVICLRAEISQSTEDFDGAYSLFCNAADKFTAGIDALVEKSSISEAYRLAGTALVGAYYCAVNAGFQEDAFSLLLEAEELLGTAGEDPLVRSKLDECRQLIRQAD